MPFGHVPHLFRAILRYFQISYFSTDLLRSFSFLLFFQSFRSHAKGTMKFGSRPFTWDSRSLLPSLRAPYFISQGLFRLPN